MRVVAISRDTVAQAARQRARDGLGFDLLADPELAVIGDYGLVHTRGAIFETFFVLGVPLGYPTGFARMAIPTTLLVDETGTVRWIDQATDYRVRSDSARLEAAMAAAFRGVEPPKISR